MVRVFLFTDEPVLAKGLSHVLSSTAGMEMAPVCNNIAGLSAALKTAEADVVLLDLTPDVTFGVVLELQRLFDNCKVVLWVRTISTEVAYQAIEHGVRGILRRSLPTETLIKCLKMVADGGLWFEDTLKAGFLTARTVNLTRRESQLVSLLSQGLKNKEIASTLFISEGTVKVYLSRLFHKVGVKDRFELALYGLKNMATGNSNMEGPPIRGEDRERKGPMQTQWLRSLVLERPS